jgi:hypothetical protein
VTTAVLHSFPTATCAMISIGRKASSLGQRCCWYQLKLRLCLVSRDLRGAFRDERHPNIEEQKIPPAIEIVAPDLQYIHASENDRGAGTSDTQRRRSAWSIRMCFSAFSVFVRHDFPQSS